MKLDLTYTITRALDSFKPAIDIHAQITSSDSTADTNIFMMEKLPKNFQKQYDYRFSHVADLVDMQDYPTYKDDNMAYYRTDQIVLRVRSQYIAQQVIQAMKDQVRQYVRAYKMMQQAPSQVQTVSFS